MLQIRDRVLALKCTAKILELDLYIIDAFAGKPFSGNPAAVCPLKEWPEDDLMQKIAAQNNLSETAFFVPLENEYHIRWFSPATEVDLCGHATMASAFVLKEFLNYKKDSVSFISKSGPLHVSFPQSGMIELDFPAMKSLLSPDKEHVSSLLRLKIKELYETGSWCVAELSSADEVASFQPDFGQIEKLSKSIFVVTAPGKDCDFVSRCFGPKVGIPEDPVTGSSHCILVPLWSAALGKKDLVAKQLSTRGGELFCRLEEDRVKISGFARTYLSGKIRV
jgi:PhzF family phenazine biosynthesis protein